MDTTINSAEAMRSSRPIWYFLPFAAAVALVALLYSTTFAWWWFEWTSPGSFYAHALFVPFFVGVMIWRNRERLAEEPWRPSWAGVGLLIPAMLLLMIGQRLDVTVVQSFSFMLLVFGITILMLGKGWTRLLRFPLFFVIMMMPLVPDQLINGIAFPIQMASAHLATALLNVCGLHSVQQGTLIQMETYRMAVELPCSGFKTLVSLLTFTAAFAYLVEGAMWKRWALFLVTMPLSLIINGLRITFIGMVGELISTPAAAVFHDWSGFIVLTMAFLFLFNFARILKCERFLGIPLTEEEEAKEREHLKAQGSAANEPAWWQIILAWRPTGAQLRRAMPYALALDAVLIGTLGAEALMTQAAKPRSPIATFQVPDSFRGGNTDFVTPPSPTRDKLDKEVAETLSPMRVIFRDYGGSDNSKINLFITAGNGRKTFHDPHTCSLGANAILSDVGMVDIPTNYGPIRFQECRFKHADNPEVYEIMIAYVVEGKLLHGATETRNAILRQMIAGDAGMPSYFVRVTQDMPGTEPEKRQQLIDFISGLWNRIGPVLTGKVRGEPDNAKLYLDGAKP